MKKLLLLLVITLALTSTAFSYDTLTDGTRGGVNTTYDPIGDTTAPTPNE